jgi:hypothetical protein
MRDADAAANPGAAQPLSFHQHAYKFITVDPDDVRYRCGQFLQNALFVVCLQIGTDGVMAEYVKNFHGKVN